MRVKVHRRPLMPPWFAGEASLRRLWVLSCALWAVGAQASPADDVRRGPQIFLRNAHAELGGNGYDTRYVSLAKGEGTLDLTVDARTLGIDVDATVQLRGSVTGSQIIWSFDERPATPWSLGGTYVITALRGKLVGQLRWVSGSSTDCGGLPCQYNVEISSRPETYVEADGQNKFLDLPELWTEWWTRRLENPRFRLYAGVPLPMLEAIEVAVPRLSFCTSATEREYAGEVRLTSAVSRGAWVDLASSSSARLSSRWLFIRPGERSARFTAHIPGNLDGTVLFRASSGGVMRNEFVEVHPCLDVVSSYLEDGVPLAGLGCSECLGWAGVTDRGDTTLEINGQWHATPRGHARIDLNALVGADVSWARIDPLGDLVFAAKRSTGERAAGRVRGFANDPKGPIEWVTGFEPELALASRVVTGTCGSSPCLWTDQGLAKLAITSGKIATVTNSGLAIINQTSPQGISSSLWSSRGTTKAFGNPEGHVKVLAANEAGVAVGWSAKDKGPHHPVLFAAGQWGSPKNLPLPKGAVSGEASVVGEDGVVLGSAVEASGRVRAFVVSSNGQASYLDSLLGVPELILQEVLSTTLSGTVVVRGMRAGKSEVVVLRRKGAK